MLETINLYLILIPLVYIRIFSLAFGKRLVGWLYYCNYFTLDLKSLGHWHLMAYMSVISDSRI